MEQDLKNEIMTIDEQVNAVVVSDIRSYEMAGGMVVQIDGLIKKIKGYWKEPKDKAFQAHKEITKKESEMLKPVEARRNTLTGKINAYLTEQEKIRKAEQKRQDDERRKREQDEKDKLEKRAVKADEKGKTERAEELREKAAEVYIPPVIVQPEVDKTTRTDEGTISAVKDIELKIISELEVIRGIAEKTIPLSVVTISEAKLKAHAKAFQLKELRGCSITEIMKSKFRGAK